MNRLLRSVCAGLVLAYGAKANLTGSGTITYHDYQAIAPALLVNNPPSCGMPYAQLDVTRITAVQAMNTATDCGKCIKVTNTNNPSKFVYVLAVDTGGRGLDLSEPAFGRIFDIADGVGPAEWAPADSSYCAGIWNNGGQGSGGGYQEPATSAVASTMLQPAVTSSAPAAAATTVQQPQQQQQQAPSSSTPSLQIQTPRSIGANQASSPFSSDSASPVPHAQQSSGQESSSPNTRLTASSSSEIEQLPLDASSSSSESLEGSNSDTEKQSETASSKSESNAKESPSEDSSNGETTHSSSASTAQLSLVVLVVAVLLSLA
ncbi:hypothetical protein GGI25_004317 [Coemansia spiralis]|uniref:Expansin-like EG45 domain-containing protein n=2 Tax=Coemansia TaxID=4863 RepID=A0A9W8G6E7_9FUNG|nr:hypothetical protein BX070DRAFT_249331 [Coemansia spiralis]KAJ1990844.1 hypothetical protein EDC05_003824 [Coemansia umbellata]KAJ2622630.1 hypothetical protein GGI26_003076 [Coemansia sp. RSA 1358]KAJ2674578.1 hypothetical protein GGI25_004317 [Coemansia spiralis]